VDIPAKGPVSPADPVRNSPLNRRIISPLDPEELSKRSPLRPPHRAHTVTEMKMVDLYTDGACRGNPGPGGYGVVLIYGKHRKELSAGFRWTTNNRMELTALINALLALKEPCRVEIISDSKYLLDAFREQWIPKWKKNGWRTASRQPVLNRDLWQQLDRLLMSHEPRYRWVKGHSQSPENNRCDQLAVAAANSQNLFVDEAYEAQNPFPGERAGPPHGAGAGHHGP
jgi:ribonuclease HI